jgi:hypothetical protein
MEPNSYYWYRVDNNQPTDPLLRDPTSLRFNKILPSMPRSFGFLNKILCEFLCPVRTTCPDHLIRLDLITLMILGDE